MVSRVTVVFAPLRVSRDFDGHPSFADVVAVGAAAVLREAGHEVLLVDAFALPGAGLVPQGDLGVQLGAGVEELVAAAPAADVVVVALSSFHRPSSPDALLTALLAGLRRRGPSTPLVLADLSRRGPPADAALAAAIVAACPDADALLFDETGLDAVVRALASGGRPATTLVRAARASGAPEARPLAAWDLVNLPAYWAFQESFARAPGLPPAAFSNVARPLPLSAAAASSAQLVGQWDALVALGADGVLALDAHAQADEPALHALAARATGSGVPLVVACPIGLPGQTREEVNATLARALELHETTGAWPSIELGAPAPGQVPRADLVPFKWTFDRRLEAGQHPTKVIMNATYRCNNRCTFCATGTRTQFDGNLQRQKEILLKYRRHGVRLLDIDGGEPTLHPNLFELVSFARQAGFEKVNVTTNGRMASYEAFARQLVDCGVTSLLFSIHGHTAQIHAQNVGVAEAFDQTLAGVRHVVRLAPRGLELGANVTVTKSNFRYLPEMAQLVFDLGLRWYNIQFLTPFGRATRATSPDTQEAADVAMRVIDRFRDRMKFQVINLPFCFMPGYEEFLVGDLLKLERTMIFVNSDEVNLFEYLRERRTRKQVCEACPRAVFCGGFYELDNVPEPTWLVTPEDLVRPMTEGLPERPIHVRRLGTSSASPKRAT